MDGGIPCLRQTVDAWLLPRRRGGVAHWPNFTRLPQTPNSLRIAALLVQHPTSVTLAARLLKIEREELYQFYSAARCAGLARAVNRKPEEPKLAPHRHQTLLAALLNKIAGI